MQTDSTQQVIRKFIGYAAGALAAIDAVGQIGEDSERQSTGRALMDALAATRRSEGRPF